MEELQPFVEHIADYGWLDTWRIDYLIGCMLNRAATTAERQRIKDFHFSLAGRIWTHPSWEDYGTGAIIRGFFLGNARKA